MRVGVDEARHDEAARRQLADHARVGKVEVRAVTQRDKAARVDDLGVRVLAERDAAVVHAEHGVLKDGQR